MGGSAETTTEMVDMKNECECHPECQKACRVIEHPTDSPCLWPGCLTIEEMRAIIRELTIAGDIEPNNY